MAGIRMWPRLAGLAVVGTILAVSFPGAQTITTRQVPRLEAVAETKLLMEGVTAANFRGLERMLREPPATYEAWVFARGQALLIAEGGNLLLLRPPKNRGQDTWQQYSMELRRNATELARHIAARDIERSRAALRTVADTCNRCHQTFQSPTRIVPFAQPDRGAAATGNLIPIAAK
jgi:hypothetical protein